MFYLKTIEKSPSGIYWPLTSSAFGASTTSHHNWIFSRHPQLNGALRRGIRNYTLLKCLPNICKGACKKIKSEQERHYVVVATGDGLQFAGKTPTHRFALEARCLWGVLVREKTASLFLLGQWEHSLFLKISNSLTRYIRIFKLNIPIVLDDDGWPI